MEALKWLARPGSAYVSIALAYLVPNYTAICRFRGFLISEACTEAAGGGHLDVVKYARTELRCESMEPLSGVMQCGITWSRACAAMGNREWRVTRVLHKLIFGNACQGGSVIQRSIS